MKLFLPPKVKLILDILHKESFEAFAVGGCVRDSILARTPDDWDITTSAAPEEVKGIFRKTVDTGIQHGTVTVLAGGEGFEVTTYRVDGKYEDARHPSQVTFTASLEEDLLRRDFTINAMAYNEEQGLVDLYGGMEDLQKKVIRCVGNPRERFTEDALRMLRAVRFSAQLGFRVEEKTRDALVQLAPNLEKVSAERIQTELVKLLLSPHPEYLQLAWETGMTKVFLPEFDRMMETPQNTVHHCFSVGIHTLKSMEKVEADKSLRAAMLLHDAGKPKVRTVDENGRDHFKNHVAVGETMAVSILRRLKFDNETTNRVRRLVRWHDYRVVPVEKAVRRAVHRVGEDIFQDLLKVQRADALAKSGYGRKEALDNIAQTEEMFVHIMETKQCVSLKTLAVTGRDLIGLGMKPGKEIGEMLEELLREVLDDPSRNTPEYLCSRACLKIHS